MHDNRKIYIIWLLNVIHCSNTLIKKIINLQSHKLQIRRDKPDIH